MKKKKTKVLVSIATVRAEAKKEEERLTQKLNNAYAEIEKMKVVKRALQAWLEIPEGEVDREEVQELIDGMKDSIREEIDEVKDSIRDEVEDVLSNASISI